jgi:hypothetical protein
MFAHETNKSRKLLLEIGQTGLSGFVSSGENILFPVKWHLTRKKNKIHNNFGGCGGG